MSSSHTLGEAEEEGLRRGKWRGRERFVNGIGECAVEMDTSHRGCIQGGGGKACLVFLHIVLLHLGISIKVDFVWNKLTGPGMLA